MSNYTLGLLAEPSLAGWVPETHPLSVVLSGVNSI